MTAAALIGLIVVILSLTTVVLALHIVFKAHSKTLETLNSVHVRQSGQLDTVLDRLVALDWEKLAALRSVEGEQEGGFFPPDLDEDQIQRDEEASRWASLRELRLRGDRMTPTSEEQALLDEDFPDELGVDE